MDHSRTDTELVVAIDGPSGSGKSSTAREVARRLRLAHLDTGAMYRAVACEVARRGIAPATDPQAVVDIAEHSDLVIDTAAGADHVVIDGHDVTEEIRDPRTSASVSAVATIVAVRRALTARMRRIVDEQGRRIVVEGRDITTVVCPDAQVRVLLVADPQVRIARRQAELGEQVDREKVTDSIVRRDRDDSTVSSFQAPAQGVSVIDSTFLGLEEVVERVLELCSRATG